MLPSNIPRRVRGLIEYHCSRSLCVRTLAWTVLVLSIAVTPAVAMSTEHNSEPRSFFGSLYCSVLQIFNSSACSDGPQTSEEEGSKTESAPEPPTVQDVSVESNEPEDESVTDDSSTEIPEPQSTPPQRQTATQPQVTPSTYTLPSYLSESVLDTLQLRVTSLEGVVNELSAEKEPQHEDGETSTAISRSLFRRQVDSLSDSTVDKFRDIRDSFSTDTLSVANNAGVTGDLTVEGAITGSLSGSFSPTGDVDMKTNRLYNIGTSSSEFTSDGSLTVNADLTLSTLTQNSIPYVGANGHITEDTNNLVFDATNTRFGIATSAPTHTLTVGGSASFTGTVSGSDATSSNDFLTLGQLNDGNDTSTDAFVQGGNSFAALATLGTNDTNDLVFETNGTERLRVHSAGNVGINAASPGARLHVAEDSATGIRISNTAGTSFVNLAGHNGFLNVKPTSTSRGLSVRDTDSSNYASIGADTGYASFAYNNDVGTNSLNIDSSGNVGIGTTSSNTALDLSGALSTRGMTAPSTAPAGQGRIYFDSSSNTFKVSENSGAYEDLIGGGATVAGSDGAVQFNSSGSLGADDANFFWDDTNDRLGIGTNSPIDRLSLTGGSFRQTISTDPVQVGAISNTDLDNARVVHVQGSYAYVVSNTADSLTVIDISDPATPTQVGTISNTDLDTAFGVHVQGSYAYVASRVAETPSR